MILLKTQRIFTLIMYKIFIQAPKTMRKVMINTIWIFQINLHQLCVS